jgi:hypothetical protein
MSQEWLKQLAELSNDKDLRKRAQQMQKAQRAAARPGGGPQRSLLGAAFGSFFRWLFLFGLAEAAAMFVTAQSQGLANESWGYIFHYVVWYALTQPIFPAEIYAGLQDWFGLLPADLSAFYDKINPIVQDQQDKLVYYVPAAAALAVTLFFLPAINAARRRSPIRVLVWLANWAVIVLFPSFGEGVMALWLGAFLFSLVGGGGQRAPRQPQPQPQQQAAPQQPRPASQQRPASQPRPSNQPQRPVRAQAATPARESAVQRAVNSVVSVRHERTVSRRDDGRSWIRGR